MSRKLKPLKPLYWKTPRICAFCHWFVQSEDGHAYCQRAPESVTWDTGDADYYRQVCGRFRRAQ